MCCAKLDDSSQTTHVKSEVTTFSVVLLKINKKKTLIGFRSRTAACRRPKRKQRSKDKNQLKFWQKALVTVPQVLLCLLGR